MVKLTHIQVGQKIKSINDYIVSSNAVDGSKVDANANVASKNIATLEAELNKDINIQINRTLVKRQIAHEFDEELANE